MLSFLPEFSSFTRDDIALVTESAACNRSLLRLRAPYGSHPARQRPAWYPHPRRSVPVERSLGSCQDHWGASVYWWRARERMSPQVVPFLDCGVVAENPPAMARHAKLNLEQSSHHYHVEPFCTESYLGNLSRGVLQRTISVVRNCVAYFSCDSTVFSELLSDMFSNN